MWRWGKEETGIQIWKLARSGLRDSGKVLASASSGEEVGSLAFSLPFSGFPERNFRGEGLEGRLGNLKGTTDWWKQMAHTMGARGRAAPAAEADCHRALAVPPLPQREHFMFARPWPTSARVQKKHMESITEASTCGLEKSALSPNPPFSRQFLNFYFSVKKYGVIQYTIIPLSCLHSNSISETKFHKETF